jgi:hypothetical protein
MVFSSLVDWSFSVSYGSSERLWKHWIDRRDFLGRDEVRFGDGIVGFVVGGVAFEGEFVRVWADEVSVVC